MRKLRVVFDAGHDLEISVNVLAIGAREARALAIRFVESILPEYCSVLDGVPSRCYDAAHDPCYRDGVIAVGLPQRTKP